MSLLHAPLGNLWNKVTPSHAWCARLPSLLYLVKHVPSNGQAEQLTVELWDLSMGPGPPAPSQLCGRGKSLKQHYLISPVTHVRWVTCWHHQRRLESGPQSFPGLRCYYCLSTSYTGTLVAVACFLCYLEVGMFKTCSLCVISTYRPYITQIILLWVKLFGSSRSRSMC